VYYGQKQLLIIAGPDLKEGKLGSCTGPPQLGGLQETVKIITEGNIKIHFETDNLE